MPLYCQWQTLKNEREINVWIENAAAVEWYVFARAGVRASRGRDQG